MAIDSKGLLLFIHQKQELDAAIEKAALAAHKASTGQDLNAQRPEVGWLNQPRYQLQNWELIDGHIFATMFWSHQSPDSTTIRFPASDLWS